MLLLRMIDIVKQFPGVLANDHVNFELEAGEIHALLGENGAGKSTLMKILAGGCTADSGTILIDGQPVSIHSPRDALEQGIGMIYQHFMLVDSMTVLENAILGQRDTALIPDRAALKRALGALAAQYNLQIDLDASIWQLSVGEQQRVEILRLLYRSARIIILDEPTAVLTPQETHQLAVALRQMTQQGKGVVIITHKLQEVMEFADRVTVLRKGRNVATLTTAQTNPMELVRLMLGRDTEPVTRIEGEAGTDTVLEARNVSAVGARGVVALKGVSLALKRGEIFGIAGVAGNGQNELADALSGMTPTTGGSVLIGGRDVTNRGPGAFIEAGVAYIPEDRLRTGSVGSLSLQDNLILKGYRQPPIARGPLLAFAAARAFARDLIQRFGVSTPGIDAPVSTLSGGNVQKAILARELSERPKVIIAAHPTRGLDVGAAESIHRLLIEQAARGAAVLLISEDLDELRLLCQRIGVMHEGEIVGIVDGKGANLDDIGLMMAGARRMPEQAWA